MLCEMSRAAALPVFATIVLATFGLGACDEQSMSGAASQAETPTRSDGAHWQKVCSKEYFYRFSDAKSGEDSYCSEWQNKCVGKNGEPSDGC